MNSQTSSAASIVRGDMAFLRLELPIIWMSAVAFALGLLVHVFGLWPVEGKKRA